MAGGRRFSPARFRSLALHVQEKAEGPMTLQQLCNVIWRSDFEAYRLLGKSITGSTWIKTGGGAWPVTASKPPRSAFEASRLAFAVTLVPESELPAPPAAQEGER